MRFPCKLRHYISILTKILILNFMTSLQEMTTTFPKRTGPHVNTYETLLWFLAFRHKFLRLVLQKIEQNFGYLTLRLIWRCYLLIVNVYYFYRNTMIRKSWKFTTSKCKNNYSRSAISDSRNFSTMDKRLYVADCFKCSP